MWLRKQLYKWCNRKEVTATMETVTPASTQITYRVEKTNAKRYPKCGANKV
jgi:hypothetical protein